MAWKKYFKDANLSPISGEKNPQFAKRNYSSYLPDVYTGHPNRIQRYFQYDQMDGDSEVNAALDILAEFCTQQNQENETPFDLVFKDDVIESEVKLLKKALQQWTKSNQFKNRSFRIFRFLSSSSCRSSFLTFSSFSISSLISSMLNIWLFRIRTIY